MSSFLLLTKRFLRLQSINKYPNLLNKSTHLLSLYNNNNSFAARLLFSGQILGIDKYVEVRHRINAQFKDLKSKSFESYLNN